MRIFPRLADILLTSFWLLLFFNNASAQTPGKLPQGPHAVGFRSLWRLDHSRSYRLAGEEKAVSAKAPRPILINIWYPARVAPNAKVMPHRN